MSQSAIDPSSGENGVMCFYGFSNLNSSSACRLMRVFFTLIDFALETTEILTLLSHQLKSRMIIFMVSFCSRETLLSQPGKIVNIPY